MEMWQMISFAVGGLLALGVSTLKRAAAVWSQKTKAVVMQRAVVAVAGAGRLRGMRVGDQADARQPLRPARDADGRPGRTAPPRHLRRPMPPPRRFDQRLARLCRVRRSKRAIRRCERLLNKPR